MGNLVNGSSAVQSVKSTVAASGGFVVWKLSLNELAALASLIYITIMIAEKLGLLEPLKLIVRRLVFGVWFWCRLGVVAVVRRWRGDSE